MFCAAFAVLAILNALMLAVNAARGSLLALASAAGVIFCVAMIARNTRRVGTLRARERELSRPRMTPEDYKRLREMEIELGWEPSEPACDCGKSQEEHAREWGEQVIVSQGIPPGPALSGTGSLSAEARDYRGVWSTSGSAREWRATATEEDKRDAAEGAVHFAQLARVGRESCASPCRLCEARDRHFPDPEAWALLAAKLAGFKDDASLRNWIENGRWG